MLPLRFSHLVFTPNLTVPSKCLLSGGLIIPSTFFIHSIVNDSSVLRCFGIRVAVGSVISVVAVVSAVEVVVIVVPPIVAVPGIELHLHVDGLPPARVGAVAAVAPGGCASPCARLISDEERKCLRPGPGEGGKYLCWL